MDYHQFKTYEKVTNAAGFPRTRQEQGLFLLELEFCSEGETRSAPVTMKAEFSGFGDVCRLTVHNFSAYASREEAAHLQSQLIQTDPPIHATFNADGDHLSIEFLNNPPQRQRQVSGTLIFDSKNHLVTIVAQLRG